VKRTLVVCVILLSALGASAGTITSISPSSVKVNSGEHFLTIYGSGLGNVVVLDGPAGHFEVNTTATFSGSVAAWVPLEVVGKSGYYNVFVRGGTGDSNVVTFQVQGFRVWPFVIIVPEVIWAQPLTREGAYVKYEVVHFGGEDPNPKISCSPASGEFFKTGRTTVNCDAVNAYGEKASATFAVVVQDTVAPNLYVPREPIVVKAQSRDGAVVEFDAKAYDDLYGDLVPECTPRSGSLFPIGVTTVTCSATDPDLNIGYGTFDVEVLGEVKWYPLELTLPDSIYVEARSPEGEYIDYKVESSGEKPEVNCLPKSGSLFSIGTTVVVCDAIDMWGMRGHGEFLVTVIDPEPPFIEKLYATPDVLKADGLMHPVEITVGATDKFDPRPTCEIFAVTSNQRIDRGDLDKDPVDQYNITGPLTVDLRGSYTRTDRAYDVWVGCTDFYGNHITGSARVVVPAGSFGSSTSEPAKTPKKRRGPKD
jgi:hypothetical protein